MKLKIKTMINRIIDYFGFKKEDNSVVSVLKRKGIEFNLREIDILLLIRDILTIDNKSLSEDETKILNNRKLSWDQIYTFKRAVEKGISLSLFGFPELTPEEMEIAITAMVETWGSSSLLKNYTNDNYWKVIESRFNRFGMDINSYPVFGHLIIIDYLIKKDLPIGNLKNLNKYYREFFTEPSKEDQPDNLNNTTISSGVLANQINSSFITY